jgi:hypothetical protein
MKNLFGFILLVVLFSACTNDSTPAKEETTPSNTNVQNVNGNMPDTTGGVNLNATLPVDSLNDSTKH